MLITNPQNKDFHTAELIQTKDFCEEWYAGKFYSSHKVMPYIFFNLLPTKTNSETKTHTIHIAFMTSYGKEEIALLYKPFELFLSSLF